jgi:hypothetical protein
VQRDRQRHVQVHFVVPANVHGDRVFLCHVRKECGVLAGDFFSVFGDYVDTFLGLAIGRRYGCLVVFGLGSAFL